MNPEAEHFKGSIRNMPELETSRIRKGSNAHIHAPKTAKTSQPRASKNWLDSRIMCSSYQSFVKAIKAPPFKKNKKQKNIRNPSLHQPVPMETILPAEIAQPGNKLA